MSFAKVGLKTAVRGAALLGASVWVAACTASSDPERTALGTDPTCTGTAGAGEECGGGTGATGATLDEPGAAGPGYVGSRGVQDGDETDVDCGGPNAPKCAEGSSCTEDSDCEGACSYAKKCVNAPSCKPHLGGDTCGAGEVGEPGAQHESCCRSLEVAGYVDAAHPGKKVYLDKYEITAGRIRAFIEWMAAANGGVPDVKGWIANHRPAIWDPAWEEYLPSDYEGGTIVVPRRLLGDPRPEDSGSTEPPGPGVTLPPDTDQPRKLGVNQQFNSTIYAYLHGNNCGTHAGAYGFPTYYYPPEILARDNQLPRADGVTKDGQAIAAKDLLDVKSMNCITNAMLAAFCAWDGGQLATDEVLDFVTETPVELGNTSGCGTQYDHHGELLGNKFDNTVQTGGRCADVAIVNATFDAGDVLPVKNSPLNVHNYRYPETGSPNHDKSWQIAAPGRASRAEAANGAQTDVVRIAPTDEPWMDLNGNLNEAALDVSGATFEGKFSLKYRGIGYGSARSDLNMTAIRGETIRRVQRPEAKAAYTGGRCMRFR